MVYNGHRSRVKANKFEYAPERQPDSEPNGFNKKLLFIPLLVLVIAVLAYIFYFSPLASSAPPVEAELAVASVFEESAEPKISSDGRIESWVLKPGQGIDDPVVILAVVGDNDGFLIQNAKNAKIVDVSEEVGPVTSQSAGSIASYGKIYFAAGDNVPEFWRLDPKDFSADMSFESLIKYPSDPTKVPSDPKLLKLVFSKKFFDSLDSEQKPELFSKLNLIKNSKYAKYDVGAAEAAVYASSVNFSSDFSQMMNSLDAIANISNKEDYLENDAFLLSDNLTLLDPNKKMVLFSTYHADSTEVFIMKDQELVVSLDPVYVGEDSDRTFDYGEAITFHGGRAAYYVWDGLDYGLPPESGEYYVVLERPYDPRRMLKFNVTSGVYKIENMDCNWELNAAVINLERGQSTATSKYAWCLFSEHYADAFDVSFEDKADEGIISFDIKIEDALYFSPNLAKFEQVNRGLDDKLSKDEEAIVNYLFNQKLSWVNIEERQIEKFIQDLIANPDIEFLFSKESRVRAAVKSLKARRVISNFPAILSITANVLVAPKEDKDIFVTVTPKGISTSFKPITVKTRIGPIVKEFEAASIGEIAISSDEDNLEGGLALYLISNSAVSDYLFSKSSGAGSGLEALSNVFVGELYAAPESDKYAFLTKVQNSEYLYSRGLVKEESASGYSIAPSDKIFPNSLQAIEPLCIIKTLGKLWGMNSGVSIKCEEQKELIFSRLSDSLQDGSYYVEEMGPKANQKRKIPIDNEVHTIAYPSNDNPSWIFNVELNTAGTNQLVIHSIIRGSPDYKFEELLNSKVALSAIAGGFGGHYSVNLDREFFYKISRNSFSQYSYTGNRINQKGGNRAFGVELVDKFNEVYKVTTVCEYTKNPVEGEVFISEDETLLGMSIGDLSTSIPSALTCAYPKWTSIIAGAWVEEKNVKYSWGYPNLPEIYPFCAFEVSKYIWDKDTGFRFICGGPDQSSWVEYQRFSNANRMTTSNQGYYFVQKVNSDGVFDIIPIDNAKHLVRYDATDGNIFLAAIELNTWAYNQLVVHSIIKASKK